MNPRPLALVAPAPLRVVLGEGYAYLRDAMTGALEGPRIAVVGQAGTPAALLDAVDAHAPDVAVIDFSEADTAVAVAVAGEIRDRHPAVAVLVLAEHLERAGARELLGRHAGGVGYLLKHGLRREELLAAVERVAAGATALDPEIVPTLVTAGDPLGGLTPREREVLELLADGLSNQAIADRLVVTKRAVEKHVKNIFRKLPLGDADGRERRVLAALAFHDVR